MTDTENYQGMSLSVVAQLLAKVQAFHPPFNPGEAQIRAFRETAVAGRWTFDEADRAISKWGAERRQGEWLEPSTLNQLVRHMRQDRMSREAGPHAATATGATPEHRRNIMAMWADARQEAKAGTARNRALVLKHDDLCARVKAVLGYERADQWGGFVPPATIPSTGEGATGPTTDAGQGFQVNRSPVRSALLEILAEAEHREAS